MTVNMAIKNITDPCTLFKGNKAIGAVKISSCRRYLANLTLNKEMFDELIRPLMTIRKDVKDIEKYVVLKFCTLDGTFIDTNIEEEDGAEKVAEWFEDVRVVSAFHLKYRMVPDTFKEVEGYGAAFSEQGENDE